MPRRYALLIGLEYVDKNSYGGNDGNLYSPVEDALAMEKIIKKEGFTFSSNKLLNEAATKAAFIAAMRAYQKQLISGDFLLITFAGHGGQVVNHDTEEMDPNEGQFDETWCFYDGQVVDDTIYNLLAGFEEGVHIFIIADNCFSGDIIRESQENQFISICTKNKRPLIRASIILISSAQDNQEAYDGDPHSRFTTVLLKIWNEGSFKGDYHLFYEQIVADMEWSQTPNLLLEGLSTDLFVKSSPFSY